MPVMSGLFYGCCYCEERSNLEVFFYSSFALMQKNQKIKAAKN